MRFDIPVNRPGRQRGASLEATRTEVSLLVGIDRRPRFGDLELIIIGVALAVPIRPRG
jgi:hypothetical protein